MFDNLGGNNLVLFDRGYFFRNFFKSVYLTLNQFYFRLQSHASKQVMDFIASNENNIITEINIENESFKVRLTKVLLDSGEMEYLLTSLFDMKKFLIADKSFVSPSMGSLRTIQRYKICFVY